MELSRNLDWAGVRATVFMSAKRSLFGTTRTWRLVIVIPGPDARFNDASICLTDSESIHLMAIRLSAAIKCAQQVVAAAPRANYSESFGEFQVKCDEGRVWIWLWGSSDRRRLASAFSVTQAAHVLESLHGLPDIVVELRAELDRLLKARR
jgi:hypothetical protein